MAENNLICEIEQFAERLNIAPATVTSRAVGNSRLYKRLKDGGSCTMRIADRVREFMADSDRKEDAA